MTNTLPTPDELITRADALETEARTILTTAQVETRQLQAQERSRFDELIADAETTRARAEYLRERAAGHERMAQLAREIPTAPVTGGLQHLQRTAAWSTDARSLSDADAITHARAALDEVVTRGAIPTQGAEKVAEVIERGSGAEPGRMARWALTTSAPAYARAFAALLRDPERGHLEWSDEERNAYGAVVAMKRAMSLTDANGGYMVPFQLDPAVMLTNDGSNNPLRRLATIKLTTTDTWNGITSAGATAEWKSEAAEVADGSPTLAQPSIPTFFGDAFVPYSFEWGMDTMDGLGELATVLADTGDNLQATAYTTGNGTTAPAGIVTGLTGTSSEINTTGSEAIVASDAYALQNALPARFSANASWQSNIAIANTFRQFETTNGALKFPSLHENPPTLLGKPWFENSNMDGSINAAATANNFVMIYGDVARGFFIVDRIGSSIELIPNLFGANGRPTGQRGALLWFRTGSKVVVPQALRMLDVPTTA